jgi:hypothetical protein
VPFRKSRNSDAGSNICEAWALIGLTVHDYTEYLFLLIYIISYSSLPPPFTPFSLHVPIPYQSIPDRTLPWREGSHWFHEHPENLDILGLETQT